MIGNSNKLPIFIWWECFTEVKCSLGGTRTHAILLVMQVPLPLDDETVFEVIANAQVTYRATSKFLSKTVDSHN